MKKSTLVALGAVLVLFLAYLFLKEDRVSVGIQTLDLPAFDPEHISDISINGAENSAHLVKKEGAWWLEKGKIPQDFPAEAKEVAQFLSALSAIQTGYVVTEQNERLSELGLADKQGTLIELKAKEKPVWSLQIGDSGEKGQKYVRLPGNKTVFFAKGNWWQILKTEASDWRKHTIVGVEPSKLKKLTFADFSLEKEGGGENWRFSQDTAVPKDFRFDKNKAAQMVQRFSQLRATNFVDDSVQAQKIKGNLNSGAHVIKATGPNGEVYTLQVGDKDSEGKVYAALEGDSQIYEIVPYTAALLQGNKDSVRDLSLFDFDSASIVSLTLFYPKLVKLVKSDGEWKIAVPAALPKGFEWDPSQILSQLNRLKNMKALRIASSSSPTEKLLLELKDSSGKVYSLKIGKSSSQKGNEEVIVSSSIDNNKYAMNLSEIKRLETGLQMFEKVNRPPMQPRGGGMESLPPELQRQLMEAMAKQKH